MHVLQKSAFAEEFSFHATKVYLSTKSLPDVSGEVYYVDHSGQDLRVKSSLTHA